MSGVSPLLACVAGCRLLWRARKWAKWLAGREKNKNRFLVVPAQTRRGFIAHLRARQTKPLALHRLTNCLFLNGRLHIYHHFKLSGDQSFELRLCSTIYDTLLLKERLLFFSCLLGRCMWTPILVCHMTSWCPKLTSNMECSVWTTFIRCRLD